MKDMAAVRRHRKPKSTTVRFACLFRPPLGLYNRAMVLIDRRRSAGEKISAQAVLVRLLSDWVAKQEHAWAEQPEPPKADWS